MLDHVWQKINAPWHSCHSWQESVGSMITAMTTILFLFLVVAGLAALVSYARRDHFAAGHNRTGRRDELGHTDPARLAF
jgi:hypothetical protein